MQTLIDDVQKLQSTLNQLRESSARQLSHFEEELQVRSKHIQRLEAQLEAQKDYQEIRRELRYAGRTVALRFFRPGRPMNAGKREKCVIDAAPKRAINMYARTEWHSTRRMNALASSDTYRSPEP